MSLQRSHTSTGTALKAHSNLALSLADLCDCSGGPVDRRREARVERGTAHLRAGTGLRTSRRTRTRAVRSSLMAYDEDLANRLRELLSSEDTVTERKMFGGPEPVKSFETLGR
jgi:hypothetical protein